MNYHLNIFLLSVIFLFTSSVFTLSAQDNIDFLLKKNIKPQKETEQAVKVTSGTSELSYLGLGLIRFYQLFISSQDQPSCTFSLSCSHFGMEAIHYQGMFLGILLTADRLTRCNSLNRGDYKFDPSANSYYDNVQTYYFR